MKPQYEQVIEAVTRLRARKVELLESFGRMLPAGARMYTTDPFAIGATKRTVSLADGFCALIEGWNLVSARALLRLQIDTALRFSAIILVEDQEAFARAVLADERIDRLKARSGHRLTDAFLVETFKGNAPWLPEVYRRTSGYVHLSGKHIYSAAQEVDDQQRTISWVISSVDDHMPVQLGGSG